jgi:hypothetical protein
MMLANRSTALLAGGWEGLIEAAKLIPGLGIAIEGVRKYRQSLEDQQAAEFLKRLEERIEEAAKNANWYHTDDGREFFNKLFANAMNLEHNDKIEFFVNAAFNAPSLGSDQAKRLKFVDTIIKLTKPALQVLAVAVANPASDKAVRSGDLAVMLGWDPYLADACVNELGAHGVLSNVGDWHKDERSFQKTYFGTNGQLLITTLTREFSDFISKSKQ